MPHEEEIDQRLDSGRPPRAKRRHVLARDVVRLLGFRKDRRFFIEVIDPRRSSSKWFSRGRPRGPLPPPSRQDSPDPRKS